LTDRPLLYSFRRCPYAIRARMALFVSGTEFDLCEVSLRAKPAELIAASPKASVPVLLLPSGEVIDESLDIMRWALDRHDPDAWRAPLADADTLIAQNDGPFKHHLDRMKYPGRYDDSDPEAHRDAGLDWLRRLDKRLSRTSHLCDDALRFVDIALFPFVRQFIRADEARFDAEELGGLRRWYDGIAASLAFQSVMAKA
jgi:glutathione S-transferase